MFRALFGSWVWRTTALIMSVVGLITGLALTGALPGGEHQTGPVPAQTYATASSRSVKDSIPLAFPDLPWLNQHQGEAGGESSQVTVSEPNEEPQPQVIVEEVVAAPTPGCINEVTRALTGLVAGVAAVNGLEQAHALDGQARQILASANRCAQEAAAGAQAVDQANLAVQQATTVAAQIAGLVGKLAAAPQPAQPQDPPAAGGVGSAVGGVLGLTLGVVGQATGAVGGVLNAVLGPR